MVKVIVTCNHCQQEISLSDFSPTELMELCEFIKAGELEELEHLCEECSLKEAEKIY